MATTDEPALRVVAWHMLKQALEQKLRERAAVNNDTWEVALDGKAQLCFDQAGLTLQPIRSLFGESVPGVTTLTVNQSVSLVRRAVAGTQGQARHPTAATAVH